MNTKVRVYLVAGYVLAQGIVPPLFLVNWGQKPVGVIVTIAVGIVILVAAALGKRISIWALFLILLSQLYCIESKWFTSFVNAGYGIRMGLITGPSYRDAGLGCSLYNGYIVSMAVGRPPNVPCVTNGVNILSAFMINLSVVPPLLIILPALYRKNENRGGSDVPPICGPAVPVANSGITVGPPSVS